MGYLNPHTHDLDGHRPLMVTICGSTRFQKEIAEANSMLTLAGHIVLAPGVFQHDADELTGEQKVALGVLHLAKIQMSDAIYVVNPGGYVGSSTQREIEYARQHNKLITHLVQPSDAAAVA